jgi:Uma2 family endonuclease
MATLPAVPLPDTVPLLENGDQLSRAEFERRYHLMTAVKKAELIEGTVYVPSPVRIQKHGKPHLEIAGWILTYKAHTHGTEGADNTTVRLDLDNEPQPDLILRILPECGGATRNSEDDYVEGAPELCIEVAASSASYDCHAKKRAYRRNGVREYLLWLVEDSRVEWWKLVDGEFRLIEPDGDGILKSAVFPGLWLDASALLAFDSKRVLTVLQTGIDSPEHGEFVARLEAQAS